MKLVDETSSDDLTFLHWLIYDDIPGKNIIKKNLRKFNGFQLSKKNDLKTKILTLEKAEIEKLCNLFQITMNGENGIDIITTELTNILCTEDPEIIDDGQNTSGNITESTGEEINFQSLKDETFDHIEYLSDEQFNIQSEMNRIEEKYDEIDESDETPTTNREKRMLMRKIKILQSKLKIVENKRIRLENRVKDMELLK